MKIFRNLIYALVVLTLILPGCSDSIDDEVTEIDYARLFSPTELKLQVANRTNLLVMWNAVKKAESYVIEIYDNGELDFEGTPVIVIEDILKNGTLRDPYSIEGLEGETEYFLRIKAVSQSIADSKWSSEIAKTGTEQILFPIDDEELTATEVTLRWTGGQRVTHITLMPGEMRHDISEEEKAEGAVTITGLTGETEYTAKLMNGEKTRGSLTFTTKIDLGDATGVHPEDDLVALLEAAEDGDAFVLFPGEYDLGSYEITKSVKINGYMSSNKPVLYGQLSSASTVDFIELKSLDFRGNKDDSDHIGQFFNMLSGSNINRFILNDCEISYYKNQFIYNNTDGIIGDFVVEDCLIHDIAGSGGDGIDYRKGSMGTMTIKNSTFYNGFRTFVRMQAPSTAISFTNCTFYRISNFDNGNNHGLFRIEKGGTFSVENCLLVETGNPKSDVATAGNFCRRSQNMDATASYGENIYYNCSRLWEGLYTDPAECKATELDPEFADPENGDFTVGNIVMTAGDPRWLNN